VNPLWVRLGGVREEGVLGASSLILMLVAFLPMTFLSLGGGGGAAAALALRLPVHVFVEPALGPQDEATTKPAFGAWAETGIARIGDPL
jgi:hypothetical protein